MLTLIVVGVFGVGLFLAVILHSAAVIHYARTKAPVQSRLNTYAKR